MKMRTTEGLIGEFGTRNYFLWTRLGRWRNGFLAN